jgi:hypothetical protein
VRGYRLGDELNFIKYLLFSRLAAASKVVEGETMFRKVGVLMIAFGAALILNISAATAQTRSGGSWSGRTGNNTTAQPSYPLNNNQTQAQQQYAPNMYQSQQQYAPNSGGWQQRGYSNGYEARQSAPAYGYSYSRGNSYSAPDYRSDEPRYSREYERRGWRERMWRERRRHHGWDW